MTREEAKQLLPVIQAWAEGEAIQFKAINDPNSQWDDVTTQNPQIGGSLCEFRIKPQPTYRPFKNKEECWQEMQKHQPFGWLIRENNYFNISYINRRGVEDECFENFLEDSKFIDGQPFGILEE